MKLTAYVAFSGEFGDPEWRAAFNSTEIKLDVDAAADELSGRRSALLTSRRSITCGVGWRCWKPCRTARHTPTRN
jgi:hypothetical protein